MKKTLFKLRGPGYPVLVVGEEPLGNGCECRGCRDVGIYVAHCVDGVTRELCENHFFDSRYVRAEERETCQKLSEDV